MIKFDHRVLVWELFSISYPVVYDEYFINSSRVNEAVILNSWVGVRVFKFVLVDGCVRRDCNSYHATSFCLYEDSIVKVEAI